MRISVQAIDTHDMTLESIASSLEETTQRLLDEISARHEYVYSVQVLPMKASWTDYEGGREYHQGARGLLVAVVHRAP